MSLYAVLIQTGGFRIPGRIYPPLVSGGMGRIVHEYVCEPLCGPLARRPWGLVVSPSPSDASLWESFAEAVEAADRYRRKRFDGWRELVWFRIADENLRPLSEREALAASLAAAPKACMQGPGSSNNPDKVSRMRLETENHVSRDVGETA